MSIIKYIDLYIGALINMLLYVYAVRKIFDCEIINNKLKILFNIVISAFFISVVNVFNKDLFKIIFTLPFVIVAIKNINMLNYKKSMFYVIIATLYMFVGELIVGIIVSLVPFSSDILFNNILGTTIGASIISVLTLPIIYSKKIKNIVNDITINYDVNDNVVVIILIIVSIGALVYKNMFNNDFINVIINIIIAIFFIIIIYMYYNENAKSKELSLKYNEMLEYLEKYEKELVEKRKIIHEYKNQLIIINGYIGDDTKLKNYMQEIIEEQKSISENSMIQNIDKLPKGLKGLVYYKLSHVQNKISIDLNVKGNLAKFDKLTSKDNKDALKVISILLDNAIEATMNEVEKYICLEFSIKKGIFDVIIINSCSNKVKVSKIMELGFSTKGEKRGYGLTLVRDIVKHNKNINLNLESDDEKFVANLKIKL